MDVVGRETVLQQARDLVGRVYAWFPQWMPPPFDPRLYAEMLNFPVILTELPEHLDAVFVPIGECPKILLNERFRSKGRRNFSLAHEIAHTFFPDVDGLRYRTRLASTSAHQENASERAIERLCDEAASELLMPAHWYRAALDRYGVTASSLVKVAQTFDVSLEAAAIRLTEVSASAYQTCFAERTSDAGSWMIRKVFSSRRAPGVFRVGEVIDDTGIFFNRASTCGREICRDELVGDQRAHISACALDRVRLAGPARIIGLARFGGEPT